MIKTLSDKYTKALYETEKSRKLPPGNKLHQLTNAREGQHAIAINDQWRICFRFNNSDVFDVEVCDYH